MEAKTALGIITILSALAGCATSPTVEEPLRWTVAGSGAYGDALIESATVYGAFSHT